MTKHDLEQYIHLTVEMEQIEDEIQVLKASYFRSPLMTGLPGSKTKASDKLGCYVDNLIRLKDKLLQKQYEVHCALDAIEACIETLPPKERSLLRKRYIQALPWDRISKEMRYSKQRLWQIHAEILKKIRDN